MSSNGSRSKNRTKANKVKLKYCLNLEESCFCVLRNKVVSFNVNFVPLFYNFSDPVG